MNYEKPIDALKRMSEGLKEQISGYELTGCFFTSPPEQWEFNYTREEGEALILKEIGEKPVLQRSQYISKDDVLDEEELNIDIEKIMDVIKGKIMSLGLESSKIFILLHKKNQELEVLATITTKPLGVLTIKIDAITSRIKEFNHRKIL